MGGLLSNAIGGVAGRFLALPIIAILKIIFDRIESLRPWVILPSDEEAVTPGRRKIVKKV